MFRERKYCHDSSQSLVKFHFSCFVSHGMSLTILLQIQPLPPALQLPLYPIIHLSWAPPHISSPASQSLNSLSVLIPTQPVTCFPVCVWPPGMLLDLRVPCLTHIVLLFAWQTNLLVLTFACLGRTLSKAELFPDLLFVLLLGCSLPQINTHTTYRDLFQTHITLYISGRGKSVRA